MFKTLNFKRLTPGFSLHRAECELGDFRVWFSEETWWWGLNDDGHSYGSEETMESAIESCQKHYESVLMKADLEKFCRVVLSIIDGKETGHWFVEYNGLCSNAVFYDDNFGTHVYPALSKIFKGASYPFNMSIQEYNSESDSETLYQNKERLAFLRKHGRID